MPPISPQGDPFCTYLSPKAPIDLRYSRILPIFCLNICLKAMGTSILRCSRKLNPPFHLNMVTVIVHKGNCISNTVRSIHDFLYLTKMLATYSRWAI